MKLVVRPLVGEEPSNRDLAIWLRALAHDLEYLLNGRLTVEDQFEGGQIATGSIEVEEGVQVSGTGTLTVGDSTTIVRLDATSAVTLEGITMGVESRRLILVNVGSNNITVAHESNNASAQDRIITHNGSDIIMEPGRAVALWHDSVSERWRVVGTTVFPAAGGGGGGDLEDPPPAANRWYRSSGSGEGDHGWSTWGLPSSLGSAGTFLASPSSGSDATFRAITGTDLSAGIIGTSHIANSAITTSKIANDAVTAAKIASQAVGTAHLQDLAVTAQKVAASAIQTAHLVDEAVTAAKIAEEAVGEEHLQDLAVTAQKVAASAITTEKIADAAIVAGKIAANVLVGGQNLLGPSGHDEHNSTGADIYFIAGNSPLGDPEGADLDLFYLEEGDIISFSADVKVGTAQNAKLYVVFRDAADQIVEDFDSVVTNSSTYTRLELEGVEVPAGATQIAFSVTVGTSGTFSARRAMMNRGYRALPYEDPPLRAARETLADLPGQIEETQIATGAITETKIADNSITSPKIVAGSVTTAKLDALAVTADKIAANAVTTAKLDALAVTTEKIAAGAVTANQIAANQVQATHIAAGAVTTAKIDALAVTAQKIAANAITSEKIAASAITSDKIAANQIQASHIAAGQIQTNHIVSGAVTTDKLDALSVTTPKIAAGAITADKIGANQITSVHIAASQIQAAHIASGQIQTAHLAAGAVTTATLDALAVTSAKIAAGAITASKLAITGDGFALNDDPTMSDLDAWELSGSWTVEDVTSGPAGPRAFRVSESTSTTSRSIFSRHIPIDVNRTYRVSVWAVQTMGDGKNYLSVGFYDADGVRMSGGATGWSSTGTYYYWHVVNQAFPSTWTRYEFTFGPNGTATIPSGAKTMRIGALVVRAGTGTSRVFLQDFRVEEVIPSVLIQDGAITAPKIAAGVITASHIAAGTITANQIANSTITNAKIVDGTITGAKLANTTITGSKIANSTITATQIANATITNAKLVDGTITGAKIASSTITGSHIANATITGAKIANSTIEGSNIAARTISAQNLVLGSFDNLAQNPGFELGSASPHSFSGGGGSWSVTTGQPRSGTYHALYNPSGQSTTARIDVNGALNNPNLHPYAAEGDEFYAECWARCAPGGGGVGNRVRLRLDWRNGSGANISTTAGTLVTTTTTYQKVSVTGTAPAGAAYVALRVEVLNDGNPLTIRIDDIYFRRMVSGELVVDGAITASKIAAGAITAAKIASNTITAAQIAAGTITGSRIAANTITASNLNVSTLSSISANIGTITAGRLQNAAGTRYLDLNASGSNPFLKHEALELRANGSATFSGALEAASGTFAGDIEGGRLIVRDGDGDLIGLIDGDWNEDIDEATITISAGSAGFVIKSGPSGHTIQTSGVLTATVLNNLSALTGASVGAAPAGAPVANASLQITVNGAAYKIPLYN